jgi:hypothetical protein
MTEIELSDNALKDVYGTRGEHRHGHGWGWGRYGWGTPWGYEYAPVAEPVIVPNTAPIVTAQQVCETAYAPITREIVTVAID